MMQKATMLIKVELDNWLCNVWMKCLPGFTIMLILTLVNNVKAESPFTPDRPGFGTGTHTVEPGTIYLELGYEFGSLTERRFSQHRMPDTNIRYGLNSSLEINLMWDGLYLNDGASVERSLGLGAKHGFYKGEQGNTSVMAILGFSKQNDLEVASAAGLLWDYRLFTGLELMGVLFIGHNEELFSNFSLGLQLEISDRTGVYGEYYNEYRPGTDSLNNYMDAGITFLISPKVQLDTYFTMQLTKNSTRYFGAGYARKF